MTWKMTEASSEIVKEYQESLKINKVLANILINRGISIELADKMINNPVELINSPFTLVNIDKAIDKLVECVDGKNTEIWIFADFDCDGVTSGYVPTDYLRKVTDNEVHVYYPERRDGYGLSMEFCEMLVERKKSEGIEDILVITVDNGITCIEEVDYLQENGIDIIITDHHEPKDIVPNCIIVNPHIEDDGTYHELSGCGVIYKLLKGMQDRLGITSADIDDYLYVVAIGTIADMMPMTPENIGIVRLGLEQLNNKKTRPENFKEFLNYIGKDKVNPSDIAWELAPRINACGRMGDIDKAAMLFFMADGPKEDLKDLIIEIEELNEERKALSKKAKQEIAKQDFDSNYACVYNASKFPGGLSGIIAGKISEVNKKVAFSVAGDEILSGSARSIKGIDLQPLLKKEKEKGNIIDFGGHEAAAGFTVKEEKLHDFQESVEEYLKNIYSMLGVDIEEREHVLKIDCNILLSDIKKDVFEQINLLPYDRDIFSAPVLSIKNLEVEKVKASRNNEENICLSVKDLKGNKADIWAWGFGSVYEDLGNPKMIDLAGNVERNFMNKNSFTFKVEDMRESI